MKFLTLLIVLSSLSHTSQASENNIYIPLDVSLIGEFTPVHYVDDAKLKEFADNGVKKKLIVVDGDKYYFVMNPKLGKQLSRYKDLEPKINFISKNIDGEDEYIKEAKNFIQKELKAEGYDLKDKEDFEVNGNTIDNNQQVININKIFYNSARDENGFKDLKRMDANLVHMLAEESTGGNLTAEEHFGSLDPQRAKIYKIFVPEIFKARSLSQLKILFDDDSNELKCILPAVMKDGTIKNFPVPSEFNEYCYQNIDEKLKKIDGQGCYITIQVEKSSGGFKELPMNKIDDKYCLDKAARKNIIELKNIKSLCEQAEGCLNTLKEQEVIVLFDSLASIMAQINIKSLEESLLKQESQIDLKSLGVLNQLQEELKSCNNQKIEQFHKNFTEDAGLNIPFEQGSNKKLNIGKYVSNMLKELDESELEEKEKFKASYLKCVTGALKEDPLGDKYGGSYGEQNLLHLAINKCEIDILEANRKDEAAKLKLIDINEKFDSFKKYLDENYNSYNQMGCDLSSNSLWNEYSLPDISPRYQDRWHMYHRNEDGFDADSGYKTFVEKISNCNRLRNDQVYSFILREEFSKQPFAIVKKYDLSHKKSKKIIKKNFEICMKEKQLDTESCAQKVITKSLPNLLIKKVVETGDNAKLYSYNSSVADSLVNQAMADKKITNCYRKNQSVKDLAICDQLVTEKVKKEVKPKVFDLRLKSEIAVSAFSQDLAKVTKTLSRDVTVYHHFKSPEEKPANPINNRKVKSFLRTENKMPEAINGKKVKAYFYAEARGAFSTLPSFVLNKIPATGATMAGRGLYFAADPNSTANYGENMLQMTFRKKSRFIDLRDRKSGGRSTDTIKISYRTHLALKEAGCHLTENPNLEKANDDSGTDEYDDENNDISGVSVYSENEKRATGVYLEVEKSSIEARSKCMSIFNSSVRQLGLDFLAYGYGASYPSFCKSTQQRAPAFVALKPSYFGNVKLYNNLGIKELQKKLQAGEDLSIEEHSLAQIYDSQHEDGTPTENNSFDEITKKHVRESMFLCDDKYEEDQVEISQGDSEFSF